jgi:hypothetical protein
MYDPPSRSNLTKPRRSYWKQFTKKFIFEEVNVYSKCQIDFDWNFCGCRSCHGRGNRGTQFSKRKTHHQKQEIDEKEFYWTKSKNVVWPWI